MRVWRLDTYQCVSHHARLDARHLPMCTSISPNMTYLMNELKMGFEIIAHVHVLIAFIVVATRAHCVIRDRWHEGAGAARARLLDTEQHQDLPNELCQLFAAHVMCSWLLCLHSLVQDVSR